MSRREREREKNSSSGLAASCREHWGREGGVGSVMRKPRVTRLEAQPSLCLHMLAYVAP